MSSVNAQDLNESTSDFTADESCSIPSSNQDDECLQAQSGEYSQEILSDVPISDNLSTVESGVVSGGVDIAAVHPWAPSDPINGNKGNITYVIPADASDIKFAYVYVNIYSGSASPAYGSVVDINITTENGTVKDNQELWYSTGTTDGVNYIVNDYITKCYSDYMIFYDITEMVQGLPGTAISVDVLSTPLQGKNFDGRIKLVSVVLAYDDGDNDIINYWFNAGQAWTNNEIYSNFDTKNVELTDECNSTLVNIALSSIDGQYILNNDHLFDSEEYIEGDYYQYHKWLVDDYMVSGEETSLKYIASKDGWGSFKSVMSLLTIQKPYVPPVAPKNQTAITISGDTDKKQIKITLIDIDSDKPIAGANIVYVINEGDSINKITGNDGSFVIENLIGDVKISVTYAGDETFDPSNQSDSFNFPKLSSKIMITSIDGVKLELTAILVDNDGNPIGDAVVSYTLDNINKTNVITDDGGEFTVNVKNNAVLKMIFEGNDAYNSTNAAITIKNIVPSFKDTKVEVPSNMKKTAVDYNAGETGTMFYFYLKDVDGNPVPNRGIKIGIFDKIYTVKTDKNGRGGLMINIANANDYTYAISFLGDDDYKASFNVCSLKIVKKPITITPAKTSYSFKATAKTKTVTATLKSSNSYIPKGKPVTLTIAGKTFKATIGAKGQISFNIGSITKKGTYKVAVKFAGTNTYAAANSKTITIKIS